jgi:hypothetical protein
VSEETPMTADEFVDVRLTKKGAELAGAGDPDFSPKTEPCVRVIAGARDFEFKPGEKQRVTILEWKRILGPERRDGEPLFELVEAKKETKKDAPKAQTEE